MSLTNEQEIPFKKREEATWTVKKMFGFGAQKTVENVMKVFVNPFDVLLGFLILVLGVSQLIGRNISIFLWIITVLVLLVSLIERHFDALMGFIGRVEKGEAK